MHIINNQANYRFTSAQTTNLNYPSPQPSPSRGEGNSQTCCLNSSNRLSFCKEPHTAKPYLGVRRERAEAEALLFVSGIAAENKTRNCR